MSLMYLFYDCFPRYHRFFSPPLLVVLSLIDLQCKCDEKKKCQQVL